MSNDSESIAETLESLAETGDIPATVREQLESIADSARDVETHIKELETKNEALNAELQETNQGLIELTIELQEAERRYRSLFETAVEGIYKTDPSLRTYELANPAMASILEYDDPAALRDAVASLKQDVFVDPDRYEEYRKRLLTDGELEEFEYRVETATGETRWVSDNVIAITAENDDEVEGFRGGVLDITERRHRQRELRRFKRATEAAGQAIFLTDRSGEISYVNPAFETITGYSAEEAIGSTPGELLGSGEMTPEYYRQMWETIGTGERWERRVVDQRKSGEYYHAHQTIAPITDDEGTVQEFIAIQADITEQVERERQVNALDRVLRHNLRNELNIIRGNAERILSMADSDPAIEGAESILQSVETLMKTADEGREITKFLSSRTHRCSVELVEVVERVAEQVGAQYPEAMIDLDAPTNARVLAAEQIDRAIEELVTNAIEHNDQSTPTVTISIEFEPLNQVEQRTTAGQMTSSSPWRGDREIVLVVEDDGPGIPELERQLLEDPGGADELSHSSGLGLWLVYWIVRRSGGEITYEDRSPRGSRIVIHLPTPD